MKIEDLEKYTIIQKLKGKRISNAVLMPLSISNFGSSATHYADNTTWYEIVDFGKDYLVYNMKILNKDKVVKSYIVKGKMVSIFLRDKTLACIIKKSTKPNCVTFKFIK